MAYRTTLNLWTTPRHLYLESSDQKQPLISISREQPSCSVCVSHGSIPSTATKKVIHGVLGLINLPLADYLVVVARKKEVGKLLGHAVWRIETVDFIPLASTSPTSSVEIDSHARCLNLVKELVGTPYFYFSYTGDLTNTLQRQNERAPVDQNGDSWRMADKRFVWNHFIANNLLQYAEESSISVVTPFLIQVIHGAVFINKCSINGKSFVWSIVTRRSRFQTGTRFFARGTDANGNVANYCETEQIVEHKDQVASHVQIRGSMPFPWKQTSCIKYMPKPKVIGSQDQKINRMTAHFNEQIGLYGEQVLINLINQTKYEGELEKEFKNLVSKLGMQEVHYEAFDFHKECKKMQYDRLSLLSTQLSAYDFGYFHKVGSSKVRQKGVLRTNCMDCLDRTNVVQSYMAAETLAHILASMGIIASPSVTELESNSHFQNIYRNCWADHGNLIAVQYAGTGALKTDYTRTGVRTYWGVLQDGWNASVRYVKNNFYDGQRTDGIKFFLGELTTSDLIRDEASKRQLSESDKNLILYIPHVMLVFVILFALTLLTSSRLSFNTVMFCSFCLGIIYCLFKLMVKNCHEFVNYPLGYQISRS